MKSSLLEVCQFLKNYKSNIVVKALVDSANAHSPGQVHECPYDVRHLNLPDYATFKIVTECQDNSALFHFILWRVYTFITSLLSQMFFHSSSLQVTTNTSRHFMRAVKSSFLWIILWPSTLPINTLLADYFSKRRFENKATIYEALLGQKCRRDIFLAWSFNCYFRCNQKHDNGSYIHDFGNATIYLN